ncbi:MAG: prepilin peptidase [Candidatus Omnitrophota bacterium]|nr:prepilin peptidase [Candidatus Omnitrophota bacterium]
MILVYIFVFIFGAVVGSFLNVCIHRLPRAESIVFPASHCANCNRPIPWYYNVPIISYLVLGGRCKFCKAKISLRYLVVEGLSAVMLTVLFWRFGAKPELAIYATFFSALIVISFIDIEHWIIPDEISLPGAALGLIISGVYPALQGQASRLIALRESLFGILFGFVSLYLIGLIGKFAYKKEAMGGGDMMLLMFIGAFLGWKLTIVAFFVAPVFGSIVGVPRLIMRKQETIQYGPFLAIAAFICVLLRNEILTVFPI